MYNNLFSASSFISCCLLALGFCFFLLFQILKFDNTGTYFFLFVFDFLDCFLFLGLDLELGYEIIIERFTLCFGSFCCGDCFIQPLDTFNELVLALINCVSWVFEGIYEFWELFSPQIYWQFIIKIFLFYRCKMFVELCYFVDLILNFL